MRGGMGILGLQGLGEVDSGVGLVFHGGFADPDGRFRHIDPVGSGGAVIRQRVRTPTAGQAVPARWVVDEPIGRRPQGRTESKRGLSGQR